ncbi:hypothetical protein HYU40_03545 [Candidatus Woesearchaeota archaeon]|nr:hypothetical protein [Candidatus Woesearchaeota archaeon]
MPAKPLSSYQMKKYAALWNKYGGKPFEFDQAQHLLNLNENNLLVLLHRLKQKGWLTTKQHPKNTRKTVYSLLSPNDAVKAIVK